MLKQVFVLFFLVSAALAEYFSFKDFYLGEESKEFVVELTKKEDINHALALLNGTTTDRPHIQGEIRRFQSPYNSGWYNYHLNPNTIQFFNNKNESCDGAFMQARKDLNRFCWNSVPCILCSSGSKIFRKW